MPASLGFVQVSRITNEHNNNNNIFFKYMEALDLEEAAGWDYYIDHYYKAYW